MEKFYLSEFFKDVRDSTLSVWGGCLSIALALIPLVLPDEWMKVITWVAAGVCFILGMYGAWLAKHKKVLEFAPLPLEISIPEAIGSSPVIHGFKFFHLAVINSSEKPARGCRVYLKKLTRKKYEIPGHQWRPEVLPHPFQLPWTPAHLNPPELTIVKEAGFDFLKLFVQSNVLLPCFIEHDVQLGMLRPGESVRYYLWTGGEDGRSANDTPTVVEVSWDGGTLTTLETAKDHLRCKIVDHAMAESETVV